MASVCYDQLEKLPLTAIKEDDVFEMALTVIKAPW